MKKYGIGLLVAAFALTTIFMLPSNVEATTTKDGKAQETDMSEMTTLESGLQIQIHKAGEGEHPSKGDMVAVHYTGTLTDGTKFDSSHDRNEPITFPLGVGKVIKGWDEGIALLKPGGKATLVIPPHLGYGARAVGPIPANSTLVFEVELLSVN